MNNLRDVIRDVQVDTIRKFISGILTKKYDLDSFNVQECISNEEFQEVLDDAVEWIHRRIVE